MMIKVDTFLKTWYSIFNNSFYQSGCILTRNTNYTDVVDDLVEETDVYGNSIDKTRATVLKGIGKLYLHQEKKCCSQGIVCVQSNGLRFEFILINY